MTPKSFRAVGVGFQEPVIRPDHIAGFRSEAFDIRHSVKHNRDGAGGPVVAGQVDADLLQFPVERPEGNSLRVSPQNVPARLHEYLPRFRPNGGKLSFPGTLLLFARPFRALGLHIKIENPACCIGIGGNSAVLYQSFEDRVDDSERIFVILLFDVPSSRYKRVPYLGRGELFSILKEADDRDALEQRAVTEIIRSMLREGRATARQATRLLESPDLPAEQRAEIERDLKALAVVLKRCAELAQEGGYE